MEEGPVRVVVHLLRGFAALLIAYWLFLFLQVTGVVSLDIVPLAVSACLLGAMPGYAAGLVAGRLEPLWAAVAGVIDASEFYAVAPHLTSAIKVVRTAALVTAPLSMLGGYVRLIQRRHRPRARTVEVAALLWDRSTLGCGLYLCLASLPLGCMVASMTGPQGGIHGFPMLILGILVLLGSLRGWPRMPRDESDTPTS